jgi:hypothetical protein
VGQLDVAQARLAEAPDAAPAAKELLKGDDDDARRRQVFRSGLVPFGPFRKGLLKNHEGWPAPVGPPSPSFEPSPRRAKLLTNSISSLARKGFEM